MAIDVRIPTILRTYTGGEKVVSGEGSTLAALIDNLESNHPGIKERLIDGSELRRFVNVYVNDEDVRFTGSLETKLDDGDEVVVLPAVAGGSAAMVQVARG
ncbi:MAG TPA: MoaD family protein [Nocardioidaceae bacterium]|nr:MoaD family protein [Nocardioidaceae bacterium]